MPLERSRRSGPSVTAGADDRVGATPIGLVDFVEILRQQLNLIQYGT